MLTEALGGRHPRDLIAHGEQNTLVDGMVESVGRIAAAFAPRPVVYRATDFGSNAAHPPMPTDRGLRR